MIRRIIQIDEEKCNGVELVQRPAMRGYFYGKWESKADER